MLSAADRRLGLTTRIARYRADALSTPALTDAECDAARDWVRGGGSLLLISDHAPFGAAIEGFARRFGITVGKR